MELIKLLDTIEEDRKKTNQKYPVKEIAFLVLTGLICGHTTWTSITEFGHYTLKWLRKYMPYKEGLPNRHNVARIIRMIKPESLNELLIAWAKAYSSQAAANSTGEEIKKLRSIFAIDGKEVRGVKARTGEVLNVVTAFDVNNGISFSTEMGTGKGQEIQMVHNILKTLNLKECIVTLDALHCQTETVDEALQYTREHWHVENKLHWRLDVVMKEDSSEVYDKVSAKNLSIIRRFALNLLSTAEFKKEKKEASIPSKMRRCIYDLDFRHKIILSMGLI